MDFGFSITACQEKDVETIKSFTKEFFSFIDFSAENIDGSSYDNIICGEALAVDGLFPKQQEKMDQFVADLGCDFARKLAALNVDISRFYLLFEEVFVGVGYVKDNELNYTAAMCEEESRLTENDEWIVLPNKKITGCVNGFVETDVPFAPELFEELCDQLCC